MRQIGQLGSMAKSTGISYAITGNAGIAGATITPSGGIAAVTADENGDYAVVVPSGWSGTITPSLEDYTFTPESKSYTDVTANDYGEDYELSNAYYVRKTGNDSTGDGSYENPWLTLIKAFTVVGAGDVLMIGDGTYAEDSGAGYWSMNKSVADWLVIRPENGLDGNVTITGVSASIGAIYFINTNQYLKFYGIKFTQAAANYSMLRVGGTLNHILFEHCQFDTDYGAYGFFNNSLSTDVKFDYCTFNAGGARRSIYGTPKGIEIDHSTFTGGRSIDFLTATATDEGSIKNTTISSITNPPLNINGGTVTIENIEVSSGGYTAVTFGVDGESGNQTTIMMDGCNIDKATDSLGHALLIGAGCVNCEVSNVTIPNCYDYGIVLKEDQNTELSYSSIGAPVSALYFKASVSPNAHHNTLTSPYETFRLQRNNISGNKCSAWTLQNNVLNVSGSGKCLSVGDDVDDAGGGVCDYNTYQDNSGLGVVRSDNDVQSLSELQAAWADYDVTTNDTHSTVV